MKTALIILDGLGIESNEKINPVYQAKTPLLDFLFSQSPYLVIEASQEAVGLPWGEAGNSEVGHFNLGTGNLNWQTQEMINQAIENGSFFKNPIFLEALNWVKTKKTRLHLIGLVSDGGVHSHINHLLALLDLAKQNQLAKNQVFIHGFTDGRDTAPKNAEKNFKTLDEAIKKLKIGEIASVSGRYFVMDRDNHWERTLLAYQAMVEGVGEKAQDAQSAIRMGYERKETDEFIKPTIVINNNYKLKTISEGDAVIFFNFRADRARQLTKLFLAQESNLPKRKIIQDLFFVTMTPYETDWKLPNLKIAFAPVLPNATLASLVSTNHMSQLHLAETEKYAHVTYFFNGGREKPYLKETQIVVPSPRVATYDLAPAMSANLVSQKLKALVSRFPYDLVVLNFANCDMVGHTGNFQAIIKAIEATDLNLKNIVPFLVSQKYQIFITADHGNAEQAINPETGEIDKEHSINPVFLIKVKDWPQANVTINPYLHKKLWTKLSLELKKGILVDVTATVASSLGLKTEEFSGDNIL